MEGNLNKSTSTLDLLDDTFERNIRQAVRMNGYHWVNQIASEERADIISEAHEKEIISVGPIGKRT